MNQIIQKIKNAQKSIKDSQKTLNGLSRKAREEYFKSCQYLFEKHSRLKSFGVSASKEYRLYSINGRFQIKGQSERTSYIGSDRRNEEHWCTGKLEGEDLFRLACSEVMSVIKTFDDGSKQVGPTLQTPDKNAVEIISDIIDFINKFDNDLYSILCKDGETLILDKNQFYLTSHPDY